MSNRKDDIEMAKNTATGPEEVFSFVTSSEDPAINSIDVTTDDGYAKAHALLVASLGGEAKISEAREAQEYTIAVLSVSADGKISGNLVGSGMGTVGRAPSDPAKWNDLQRMAARARMMALLQSKSSGVHHFVLKVLSEDFPLPQAPAASPEQTASA